MAPMDEGASTAVVSPIPDARDGLPDFRTYFEQEHMRLFRALWLVTRDRHEAEDVMQEAFVRVWERWERVSALADPVGYLYRTAMNIVRSRARRASLVLRRAVGIAPPDDSLAAVDEREALMRALAPLTRRQRAALVLTEVLGFTSREAGAVLGIRAATVRVLAARAREALRKEAGELHD